MHQEERVEESSSVALASLGVLVDLSKLILVGLIVRVSGGTPRMWRIMNGNVNSMSSITIDNPDETILATESKEI